MRRASSRQKAMSTLNHKENWNDAPPEKHCIDIIIVSKCMYSVKKKKNAVYFQDKKASISTYIFFRIERERKKTSQHKNIGC